jgi:hypothetical protein
MYTQMTLQLLYAIRREGFKMIDKLGAIVGSLQVPIRQSGNQDMRDGCCHLGRHLGNWSFAVDFAG